MIDNFGEVPRTLCLDGVNPGLVCSPPESSKPALDEPIPEVAGLLLVFSGPPIPPDFSLGDSASLKVEMEEGRGELASLVTNFGSTSIPSEPSPLFAFSSIAGAADKLNTTLTSSASASVQDRFLLRS